MQTHVEIELLVRIAIKCSLLGNYPHIEAGHRLGWTARMRLVTQLEPAPPLPEFMAWMDKRPYLVMFALREWFLYDCSLYPARHELTLFRYTVEASEVTDVLLGKHLKWGDFKNLSRRAMVEVRRELTRQASMDMTAETQWDTAIETPSLVRKKRSAVLIALWKHHVVPEKYRRPSRASQQPTGRVRFKAILNKLHTASLATFSKLRKSVAAPIIAKKMTSEETTVLDTHVWNALNSIREVQYVALMLREVVQAIERRNLLIHLRYADVGKWLDWTPGPEPLPPLDVDQEKAVRAIVAAIREGRYAPLRIGLKKTGTSTSASSKLPASAWDDLYDWILDAHVLPPLRADFDRLKETFHLVARHLAAIQQRPGATTRDMETPELRWLSILGVSDAGVEEIKAWFWKYALFNQSDDRYRHWARLLGQSSLYDFVALKLYLRLLDWYSQVRIPRISISESLTRSFMLGVSLVIDCP
jgi:hypothetical protein